jgi:hypothetical protein
MHVHVLLPALPPLLLILLLLSSVMFIKPGLLRDGL